MAFIGLVRPNHKPLRPFSNSLARYSSSSAPSEKRKKNNSQSPHFHKNEAALGNLDVTTHLKIKNDRKSDDDSTQSVTPASDDKNTFRVNDMNIQMLSENLYRQLYANVKKSKLPDLIKDAQEKLKKFGLWTEDITYMEDVSLKLPSLRGDNIEDHFWNIGKEQSEPYKILVSNFIKNGLPQCPSEWLCQKGWTKYVPGKAPEAVPFPDEKIVVLDIEVCVRLGHLPTLATAVSESAWYGWVCSDLAEGIDAVPTTYYSTERLIPFQNEGVTDKTPRLIVGHNVSYDRSKIKEQYYIRNSSLMFLDTMSLHTCIGGLTSVQKSVLKQNTGHENSYWKNLSCLSSLKDIYALYCNETLEKELRSVFLQGSILDVKKEFQDLMRYCSKDVMATYKVLQAMFPVFLHRFPHPVTLAGMLEMGSGFLPVNNNWKKFLTDADQTYEDLRNEINFELSKKSDKACRLLHNEEYKNDLWMFSEDWKTQELKLTKKKLPPKSAQEINEETSSSCEEKTELEKVEEELQKQFQNLFDLGELLPKVKPFLPGYPLWYRNLCEKPKSKDCMPTIQLSTSMQVTPKLLRLSWENFPLYHTQEYGWGILVANTSVRNPNTSIPFSKLLDLTIENCQKYLNNKSPKGEKSEDGDGDFNVVPYYRGSGIWCNHIVDNCCYFFKLPHKDGNFKNVGTPLAKDFTAIFHQNGLAGSDSIAEKILNLGKKSHYWRNNRERIMSQMVVWLSKKETPFVNSTDEEVSVGIIIPKVVVCGTLTRRAMEGTWLTASRVVDDRIGSELRSMIQAPPGYHIVGADVDSQELWIASLLGDSAAAKEHGATPIGWMTLSGSKEKKTDMHSQTAKSVGISRDHAKIMNYARIYGAGVKFAQKLLQQFNPKLNQDQAKFKAHKMFDFTKGRKLYKVKKSATEKVVLNFGQNIQICDLFQALNVCRRMGKKLDEVFEKWMWTGGTESDMFNEMEKIANSLKPVTPFLQCRLSRALEPRYAGDDFTMNTRINWVVQSGAVDFLHLMLVSMKWLTNDQVHYCFSFHDEVRYLVPSEKRYSAALAMHITNLFVRAFCASRLGIYDLPQSVAFFSSVEVDKALRKEANDDCITPSNPHGMEKGYGIPPGESLNIYETIKKTGGILSFSTTKNEVYIGLFVFMCVLKVKSVCRMKPCLNNLSAKMSQATKRKHVHREVLQGELELPQENQQIVRVIGSRGNNLHEVESPDSSSYLISMPNKFRKNVWIKKGDYILVEPIDEGQKVKAEIVKVLTSDYIKFFKKEKIWPAQFLDKEEQESNDMKEDDLFVNSNHSVGPEISDSSDESE